MAEILPRDPYALRAAVIARDTAKCFILIRREGVDVNSRFEGFSSWQREWTALHWAALTGDEAMTQMLLNLGADVNARDSEGFTPLLRAVVSDRVLVCKLLIEYGATSIPNRNNRTPMQCALTTGNRHLIALLREHETVCRRSDLLALFASD
jgi:ankyrin repeat protein